MLEMFRGIDYIGKWKNYPLLSIWELDTNEVERACAYLSKSRTWFLMTAAVIAAIILPWSEEYGIGKVQMIVKMVFMAYPAIIGGFYEFMVHRIKATDNGYGFKVYIVGTLGFRTPFGEPKDINRLRIQFLGYKMFGVMLTYVIARKKPPKQGDSLYDCV